jgi:hypothetical protein
MKQVASRSVDPDSMRDLRERAPRACIAFATDQGPQAQPVISIWQEGRYLVGIPEHAKRLPRADQEAVLLIDEGVYYFELRALYIRGRLQLAEALMDVSTGHIWFELVPTKTVAWDYGTLREVRVDHSPWLKQGDSWAAHCEPDTQDRAVTVLHERRWLGCRHRSTGGDSHRPCGITSAFSPKQPETERRRGHSSPCLKAGISRPQTDDPAVIDIFQRSMVARIATQSRDGHPSITPLYFIYQNGCIRLGTAEWTRAARQVTADARVSLLFDVERDPRNRRVVRISGRARVRTDRQAQQSYALRAARKFVLTPGAIRDTLAHVRLLPIRRRYRAQSAEKGRSCVIDVTPEHDEVLPG